MRALYLSLCAMLIMCMCATAAFAGKVNVSISNNTGKTMTYLYISPAGSQSWEEDILGPNFLNIRTLENDRYCELAVEQNQLWDLRAEFRDGSAQEYYGIDFRNGQGITLNRNDASYD